jgi:hypothetical protein
MPLREVVGDIWDYGATVIVVPTNGFVKTNGRNVMGAGLAKQAVARYPGIDEILGKAIQNGGGNHVHMIRHNVVSFPVKDHWTQDASLALIGQSAVELHEMMALRPDWKLVALPRVGCGNGRLRWSHVRPILEDAFGDDERIVIVDRA